VRDVVKRAIARGARTSPGKHVVHAATRADVRAEQFSQVRDWPESVEGFEDLAFLFTSSQLNHGVASLRFDEAALLYGLVRRLDAQRIVEIGRFKGGSTVVMASAMAPSAHLLSLDLHVPQPGGVDGARLDAELADALARLGLADRVDLRIADSRAVDLPEPGFDVLFVDGDHSYEGSSADFARWAPLLRPGGHLVAHDAVDAGGYGTTYPGVARAFRELVASGGFERLADVGTIGHAVRTAS
jgi:predicted O-methyltransferase YrrM